jgi:hypothetical protein
MVIFYNKQSAFSHLILQVRFILCDLVVPCPANILAGLQGAFKKNKEIVASGYVRHPLQADSAIPQRLAAAQPVLILSFLRARVFY